jgi:hypothetical protein
MKQPLILLMAAFGLTMSACETSDHVFTPNPSRRIAATEAGIKCGEKATFSDSSQMQRDAYLAGMFNDTDLFSFNQGWIDGWNRTHPH